MAKLYWRVKINNRWTWAPATDLNTIIVAPSVEAVMMHPKLLDGFKEQIRAMEEE